MSRILGQIMTADPVVMAAGSPGPRVVIAARPSVTLAVPPSAIAALTTSQGAEGPRGAPGAAFSGFGYVQMGEVASEIGATLAAGVRTPVAMTIDPAQTFDTLAPPFAGFAFFDGSTLRARHAGDVYDLRFTVTVTPAVSGGAIALDCTIDGAAVLTDTDSSEISAAAGDGQRLGFKLTLLPKALFVAGGARLYLTSTVPATVRAETLVIRPSNAGR